MRCKRKCYKCQIERELNDKNYSPAPLPDVRNQGYTWACNICLGAELLNLEGGFIITERNYIDNAC